MHKWYLMILLLNRRDIYVITKINKTQQPVCFSDESFNSDVVNYDLRASKFPRQTAPLRSTESRETSFF